MAYVTILAENLLPYLPFAALAYAVYLILLLRRKAPVSLSHKILSALFFVYAAAVLSVTVPFASLMHISPRLRPEIQLVPFASISAILRNGDLRYAVTNLLGNILLFVPLGFLLPVLWKSRLLVVAAAGLLFSMLIEAAQMLVGRGTDIDDLILNTAGTLLGYLIYRICRPRNVAPKAQNTR